MKSCWIALVSAMLLGATGCGVALSDSTPKGTSGNACQTDADCDGGQCNSFVCNKARQNSLDRLMLEVSAPTDASGGEYSGIPFRKEVRVAGSGTLDIGLDVVAGLSVAVSPPASSCKSVITDGANHIPIAVRVFGDSSINGIEAIALTESSNLSVGDGLAGNTVTFPLAPQTVDLYIEPSSEAGDAQSSGTSSDPCALAPILTRGLTIPSGRAILDSRLPEAEHLYLDFRASASGDVGSFAGWSIDMVEPIGGLRLSSRATLDTPTSDAKGEPHFVAHLAYHSVVGGGTAQQSGNELYRLSPPKNLVAPTYYWARAAVELFSASINTFPELPQPVSPVSVSGIVESETDAEPSRADIVAVLVQGESTASGALASFQAVSSSDNQGHFSIQLVPGSYKIYAIPVGTSKYGTTATTWSVAPSPAQQAGRLIRLVQSATLTGAVVQGPSDVPLGDATIQALPSNYGNRSTFLETLIGQGGPIGVRARSTVSSDQGLFELSLDPGRYDIAVRPRNGSGYPWAIGPSTTVERGAKGLPKIQVRNPIVCSGTVSVPGRGADDPAVPLPGARLRFYALLDENEQPAGGAATALYAVQIGEALANERGVYQLLLPDQID